MTKICPKKILNNYKMKLGKTLLSWKWAPTKNMNEVGEIDNYTSAKIKVAIQLENCRVVLNFR